VTDNAQTFASEEFEHFLKCNRIRHITSAPYHPASNGLAERAVQTFKNAMKKLSHRSIQSRVSQFLVRYRVTPQSTTGATPAELIGRKIRCKLDCIKPDLQGKVLEQQFKQKDYHDRHSRDPEFQEGDSVYFRSYSTNSKDRYEPGVVSRRTGPVSVTVQTATGTHRRHFDQIFHRASASASSPDSDESNVPMSQSAEQLQQSPVAEKSDSSPTKSPSRETVRRNPARAKKGVPPDRYQS
jgi:hypothetical protein